MLFVGATTRWTAVNEAAVEPFWQPNGGKLIGCIWHGRFSLVFTRCGRFGTAHRRRKMLISQSREGGIVAHTAPTPSALPSFAAPPPKGAQKGRHRGHARHGAAHRRRRRHGCMTPDGPRGPRMRAKRGSVQLAKIAGAR
jgi:lysophospholipid acyltransferase (LPLAT)-like uncharacterized protein